MEQEPFASPYRWVMLSLLCFGYGSFGLVSASLAPLITPILSDTNMNRADMGLVLGSWQFVYLFVAVPAGVIIDRFGLKRALFVGIVLIALSQVCRAAAINQSTMLIAVMVFGLGGPFISVGAPKLAATWFSERQTGTALGIYTVSPSVGSMIGVASANSVVMRATSGSWRLTLLVFASVPALASLTWLLFARDPQGTVGSPTRNPLGSMLESFRKVVRIPVVRVVLVMATGCFLFNHSFSNWLPEILQSGGMDANNAGFWAAVPTLVAIGAALTIPRATTDRWLTPVQVTVFGLWTASALLLAFSNGLPMYLGLLLLGIGRGASTPLLMLTLLRSHEIGPKLMGAAGGLFFTAGEIGGVLGPSLTGLMADVTGEFTMGLTGLASVSAILIVLSIVLSSISDSRQVTAIKG